MAEIDWSGEKDVLRVMVPVLFGCIMFINLDIILSGDDFLNDILSLILLSAVSSVLVSLAIRVVFVYSKWLYGIYYNETKTYIPASEISSFFSGDISDFTLHGVGLIEPRSSRQSVGVGVGRGGVGIGTSKSFFSGEEQTKIDTGRICFDNEKIQFIGATNQISWPWEKIVSVSIAHGIMDSMIFIGVSSRKKISGFTIRNEKEEAKSLADKILEKSKSQ